MCRKLDSKLINGQIPVGQGDMEGFLMSHKTDYGAFLALPSGYALPVRAALALALGAGFILTGKQKAANDLAESLLILWSS